ncbi:hypothetical protein HNP77_002358 [Treponema rectale]|uniref:Fibronectin type-III domain-containing protein n=1 Tax=Treponema rectale TaxID=744512 RepID=A0A840SB58_9SPIR|nr:fibronectin type III domain-containing protein [Treponema rectale]MBB5219969.1 hypothetical protein [Treponema rectale]
MLLTLRKFFSLIPAAVLAAGMLAGCSSDGGSSGGATEEEKIPSVTISYSGEKEVSDVIPGITGKSLLAAVENADDAVVSWTAGNEKTALFKSEGNSAEIVFLAEGSFTVNASITTADNKTYTDTVVFSSSLASPSPAAVTEPAVKENSVTEHEAELEWAPFNTENGSVLAYVVILKTEDDILSINYYDKETASVKFENLDSNVSFTAEIYTAYADSEEAETYSVEKVEFKTKDDVTPPESVSDAAMTLSEDGSAIVISWKNSADSDIEKFKIVPSLNSIEQEPVELTSAEVSTSAEADNTYSFNIEPAKDNRTFGFTITAYDKKGNASSEVSVKNGESDSLTVEGDSTPCAKVSDLNVVIKSVTEESMTFSASWKNPTDSDFAKVQIAGEDTDTVSFQNRTIEISKAAAGLTFTTFDKVGNENTVTVPADCWKAISTGSMKAKPHWSNAYLVSDIPTFSSGAEYSVTAIDSTNTEAAAAVISEKTTAVLRGLNANTEYKIALKAKFTDTDYTVTYTDINTALEAETVKVEAAAIYTDWETAAVVPYITGSASHKNLIGCGHTGNGVNYTISSMKYTKWLLVPGLAEPESTEHFTLEAASVSSDGTLVPGGMYAYLDIDKKYAFTNSMRAIPDWENVNSSGPQLWVDAEPYNPSYAEFKFIPAEEEGRTHQVQICSTADSSLYWWESAHNLSGLSLADAESKGKLSDSYYTAVKGEWTLTQEAPSEVTVSDISDSTATVSWKNPSNGSLEKIIVTVTGEDGTEIVSSEAGKGKNSYSVTGLTASGKYSVTVKAVNAANAEAVSAAVDFETSGDSFPPAKVSSISIDMNSGLISWTNPSDIDYRKTVVKINGTEKAAVDAADEINNSITAGTLSAGSTVSITTYDESGNGDDSSTVSLTMPSSTGSINTTYSAETGWTGQLKITGISPSAETGYSISYGIKAVNKNDEADTAVSASDYSASDKILVNGLTPGAEYKLAAVTVFTDTEKDAVICSTETTYSDCSVKPVKIVWQMKQPYSNVDVVPYILTNGSRDYKNLIGVGRSEQKFTLTDMKYDRWIVWPSLQDGKAENSFSLEATDKTAESSNLFVYFDGNSWNSNYNAMKDANWSYNRGNVWELWVGDKDTKVLTSSTFTKQSSFVLEKEGSTCTSAVPENYEGWYFIHSDQYTGRYFYSSCLNLSVNASVDKSNIDWQIAIKPAVWTGTEATDGKGPEKISDLSVNAESITGNSAVITWTNPSDADFAYVVIKGGPEDITLTSGETSYKFANLAENTLYNFTITPYDIYDNAGTESDALRVETYDVNAPDSVTDIARSNETSRTKIVLTWNEPAAEDYASVKITAEGLEPQTIAKGTTTASFDVEKDSVHTFTFATVDTSGNMQGDENNTDNSPAAYTAAAAPFADSVKASARWTKEILVTWTDTPASEDGVTYSYEVTGTDGINTILPANSDESNLISAGVQVAQFTDLTVGTEYTFTVNIVTSDGKTFTGDLSSKAAPRKVMAEYKTMNNSENPYFVASSAKALITNSGNSGGYSKTMVVYPALDGSIYYTYTADSTTDSNALKAETGTVDTFSLMLTSVSSSLTDGFVCMAAIDASKTAWVVYSDAAVFEKNSIEESALQYASFFNGTSKYDSDYPYSLRPTAEEGKIQIGAGSKTTNEKKITYRKSEGSPGVADGKWKVTYTYSTTAE